MKMFYGHINEENDKSNEEKRRSSRYDEVEISEFHFYPKWEKNDFFF